MPTFWKAKRFSYQLDSKQNGPFLLYIAIETVSCRLLIWMARMDRDGNLAKLGQLLQLGWCVLIIEAFYEVKFKFLLNFVVWHSWQWSSWCKKIVINKQTKKDRKNILKLQSVKVDHDLASFYNCSWAYLVTCSKCEVDYRNRFNSVSAEPRYNKVLRDWQNLFAITRFRYIEFVFHIYTSLFSVLLYRSSSPAVAFEV